MRHCNIYLFILILLCMSNTALGQHSDFKPTAHYLQRVREFDRQPLPDSTKIVMLGKSLTENGKDWSRRLGIDNVVNYGIIGDDAQGMTLRLHQITPRRPKTIVLMCGINDLSHGLTAEEVFENVRILIETIIRADKEVRVVVQSILPINESTGRWKTLRGCTPTVPAINRLLKEYCQAQGLTYVDIFPQMVYEGTNVLKRAYTTDGLHLTEKGYQVWSRVLKPHIDRINRENRAGKL